MGCTMHATDRFAAPPRADRPCESDRGEWGGICPGCGQRLPPWPDPLQSWHAGRAVDRMRSAQARAASRGASLRHWHL